MFMFTEHYRVVSTVDMCSWFLSLLHWMVSKAKIHKNRSDILGLTE